MLALCLVAWLTACTTEAPSPTPKPPPESPSVLLPARPTQFPTLAPTASPTAATALEQTAATTAAATKTVWLTPTTDVATSNVPTLTAESVEPTPTPPAASVHVVQPGESLLRLALQHEVPIAAIQLASQLGDDISLQAGQTLTIPRSSEWEGASPYWMVYLVEAGDTLSGISAAHGLGLEELQEANHLEGSALLSVGQALILPLEDPDQLAAQEAQSSKVSPTQPPVTTQDPAGPAADTPAPALAAPPPPGEVTGWPAEIFELINQNRAAAGLYLLRYNQTLAAAAQRHAEDCRQRGWCSHGGSDGSSPADRIGWAGYQAEGTAECWVQGDSPGSALAFWLNEVPPNDPHRRTLLSTYLTDVGIGLAAADWGYTIVADFGRPAGS